MLFKKLNFRCKFERYVTVKDEVSLFEKITHRLLREPFPADPNSFCVCSHRDPRHWFLSLLTTDGVHLGWAVKQEMRAPGAARDGALNGCLWPQFSALSLRVIYPSRTISRSTSLCPLNEITLSHRIGLSS